MIHLGNVPASTVLYIPFSTYGKTNGESITLTGLAVTDIEIYKNGSITQRSSDAGYALLDTDGIDFDGITGIHGFSIDLSDNTDSGFYAAGSMYWVVVSAVTIDSQAVNFIAATFRIVAAENTAGTPAVDTVRLAGTAQTARDIGASVLLSSGTGTGQLSFTSGILKVDVDTIKTQTVTCAAGVTVPATIASSTNITTVGAVSGAVGSVTGAVGSVTGSVGSITGITFPTNFSSLGINASGHVSRVVLVDTLTTYTGDTPQTGDSFARIGATGSGLTTLATAAALSSLVTTVGAAGAGLTAAGLSAAQVNSEVVDALATDTYAEPGQGAPAATATLAAKVNYLYKFLRNKITQTSTTLSVYADDGTTVDHKSTVSDDATTYTRGEIASGP